MDDDDVRDEQAMAAAAVEVAEARRVEAERELLREWLRALRGLILAMIFVVGAGVTSMAALMAQSWWIPLVVSAGFGVWCVVALRSMWVRVLGAYAVGAAVGLLVERFDLPFAVIIGLLGMGVGARAAWRLRRG